MATLKQLIDDGLQVGALVKSNKGEVIQFSIDDSKKAIINQSHQFLYLTNKCNTSSNQVAGFIYTPSLILGTNDWHPTTAHDSNIDPKTLPIEEPFWTGWVMWNRYKFEPIPYENKGNSVRDIMVFEDGHHQEYLKSECRPCLPPNQ